MLSLLVRTVLISVFLSASQAGAFDITVEGSTPADSGDLSDLEFTGIIFIDLDEPILFVGDRRGFFLVPVGTFMLDLGLFGVSEPIAAVRFVSSGPSAPTELAIEAAFPAEGNLERISLSLASRDETDPFSSGLLAEALDALANGCCSASLVLEPVGGPPIYAAVESLTAVPEAPAELSLALGAAVLLISGALRRKPNTALQLADYCEPSWDGVVLPRAVLPPRKVPAGRQLSAHPLGGGP